MSRGGGGVRESNETTRYLRERERNQRSAFFAETVGENLSSPPRCRAPRPCRLSSFGHRHRKLLFELRDEEQRRAVSSLGRAQGSRVKSPGKTVSVFPKLLRDALQLQRTRPPKKNFRASGPPDPLALAAPARLQHRREVALARSGAFDWRSRGRSAGIGQRERSRFPISTFRRADGDGKSRQREGGRGSKPSHPPSATPQKPRF